MQQIEWITTPRNGRGCLNKRDMRRQTVTRINYGIYYSLFNLTRDLNSECHIMSYTDY